MNNVTYASRRGNRNYGRNKNISAYQSSIKLGPVVHTVLIGLMITVLGLIYLTQATKTTGYDYEINKIDTEIAELTTKKTDLEIEKARLTALATIENNSVAQNMTKPAQTTFVKN